jgi:hypothetical protein
MMLRSCGREKEISELLRLGHWPAAASEELRAHVNGCRGCSDLLIVTQSFQQARERAAVRVQAPGVLWWRAQLRRRNSAVEKINRPILGAQIFAFAMVLMLAVGFVVFQATRGVRWASWLADVSPSRASFMDAIRWVASIGSGWVLIPGVIALALMSGIVLYLASEKH